MYFNLKRVILWPKKDDLPPRVVEFQTGRLNVISGASQTGKSALIPIVDYCLGAGRCAIPVGTIREACSWFGVIVATQSGEALIARREPGSQASTDDMYMAEGTEVEIPGKITAANANRGFVKAYLNELAGLSSLALVEGGTGFQGPPSFRDLAAFNFQPQNIIANPQVLFFKTDTTEHKEKLKNVMPYALGITTPDVIAKQADLAEKRKQLGRLRREAESLRNTADQWRTEVRVNLSLARELGLLSPETSLDISEERAISLFRLIILQADQRTRVRGFSPSPPSPQSPASEIVDLREREQELAITLAQYRKRMLEMSKLREAAESYSRALATEEDRLGIARWLLDRSSDTAGSCPICGNSLEEDHGHLAELIANLEEVERGSAVFRALPPSFDKEWSEVRRLANQAAEQIASVQKQISALQDLSEAEMTRRFTELNTSRFVGRLEANLALYDKASTDAEIRQKINSLAEEIERLAAEVDESAIAARRKKALAAVTSMMTPLLQSLSVEGASDPAELVIGELTLRIKRENRQDFLWEIGSASNWLGYHISLLLALHMYFISLASNPVPAFLMLDQPSQVYFPQKLAGAIHEDDLDPQLAHEDEQKVYAIFSSINNVVRSCNNTLQIIVVDHAGKDLWGDIPGIHPVADWRGQNKLVPQNWLS